MSDRVGRAGWDAGPARPPVRIRPGQENFEIRYTGLTFINAERMVFSYRLDGVDRDWVYAGTRRLAHYAHIPPGNYSFSVLAANSDGVWADAGDLGSSSCRPTGAPRCSTVCVAAASPLVGFGYRRRVTRGAARPRTSASHSS